MGGHAVLLAKLRRNKTRNVSTEYPSDTFFLVLTTASGCGVFGVLFFCNRVILLAGTKGWRGRAKPISRGVDAPTGAVRKTPPQDPDGPAPASPSPVGQSPGRGPLFECPRPTPRPGSGPAPRPPDPTPSGPQLAVRQLQLQRVSAAPWTWGSPAAGRSSPGRAKVGRRPGAPGGGRGGAPALSRVPRRHRTQHGPGAACGGCAGGGREPDPGRPGQPGPRGRAGPAWALRRGAGSWG